MIVLSRSRRSLGDLEVFRGGLAAIFHKVVFDHLIFVEGGESRALDRRDMDEHVLIAGHRLDEPITLGRVEPLDGAFLHRLSPSLDIKKTRPRYLRATPQAGFRRSAEFPSRETHSRTAWIRLCADSNTKIAR